MRTGRQSSGVLALVFAWGLITLLSGFGLIGMVSRIEFGPHVGDIVSFDHVGSAVGDPARQTLPDAAERAPTDATTRFTLVQTTGGSCSLDLDLVEQGGGSLVVEARRPDPTLRYQAHWAAPRDGDTDCGRSADLLISDSDMSLLAIAAGGYGVGGKRQFVLPYWTGEAVVR
jgi:hypothetical protein